MSRLPTLAAALCASLAIASGAHALAPTGAREAPLALTCMDATEPFAWHGAPESALDTDAQTPAPAPVIVAVQLPIRLERGEHRERGEDDSLPWCISADDPRCSPIEGGSLPSHTGAQPKLTEASALSWPAARATSITSSWFVREQGDARDAERTRLERPPQ